MDNIDETAETTSILGEDRVPENEDGHAGNEDGHAGVQVEITMEVEERVPKNEDGHAGDKDSSAPKVENSIGGVVTVLQLLLVYMSCTVILEIVRGKHKKELEHVSEAMLLFVISIECLICLFLIVWMCIQKETCQMFCCSHQWKAYFTLVFGVIACVVFGRMMSDSKIAIGYFILALLQTLLFTLKNLIDCHVKYDYNFLWTLIFAFGLSCNIGVLFHLELEEFQEDHLEKWVKSLLPFGHEFILFCFFLWLDFMPKGTHASHHIKIKCADLKTTCKNILPSRWRVWCIIGYNIAIAFFIIYPTVTCYVAPNNAWRSYLPIIIMYIMTILYLVLFYKFFLDKMTYVPEPDVHYFAKDEVMLTVCGIISNIHFLSALIPDCLLLKQDLTDSNAWLETLTAILGIICIVFQTQIILTLKRKNTKIELQEPSEFRWALWGLIIRNLILWLSNCLNSNAPCERVTSTNADRVYMSNVTKITYPVGIFYNFQSFEILLECFIEFNI